MRREKKSKCATNRSNEQDREEIRKQAGRGSRHTQEEAEYHSSEPCVFFLLLIKQKRNI